MRIKRQGSAHGRARGGRLAPVALVLLLTAMLASSASAAPRVRHACAAPPSPRHARCLAMRLLVEQSAGAQSLTTRGGRSASPASKPFPGFQTPQRLREAYGLPEETAAGST